MFTIEVLKVGVENRGKFSIATVDHKTVPDGKVDSRKLPSFIYKDVYALLSKAKQGDQFDIESKKVLNEKDGKEYWQWVSAVTAGKGVAPASKSAPRSTYETPEERAARQVYIVRQSSVSAAVALKPKASVEEIIDTAKQFEAYVFAKEEAPVPEVQ